MEHPPTISLEAERVTLKNIRHNTYVSDDDFVVDYFDRQFDLSEIQSVDFIVVPVSYTHLTLPTICSV